jgi:zinc/manganese transport system ATP-binding protein
LDASFPLDCRDVVMLGLIGEVGAFAAIGAEGRVRADAALKQVGLQGFADRPVGSLSAGQMQRVLFARLIVQEAPVMLLDEPFNAVDARTEADLLALIHGWHDQGRTVIAVLHDLDLVRTAFPQCLLLAREVMAFGPTADVLSQENRVRARLAAEAWVEAAPICHAEHEAHH